MATGPTLPPQAYTREILTAAFNWLQTQPESVKKLATTPDALVGLYMRAQRFGASSMETDAPVSAQNFMSDLKNLAEGLKQFEAPKGEAREARRPMSSPSAHVGATPSHHASASAQLAHAQQLAQQMAQAAAMAQAQAQVETQAQSHVSQVTPSGTHSAGQFLATNHQAHQAASFLAVNTSNYPNPPTQAQAPVPAYPAPVQAPMPPALLTSALTDRSQQMIHEVKIAMNLSSDAEAINMLVSIAYKHLKNLLV